MFQKSSKGASVFCKHMPAETNEDSSLFLANHTSEESALSHLL
jgi:hypothetical protein